ncbi:MAG: site-specific integrase [Thermoanaerobaculia bacterium]
MSDDDDENDFGGLSLEFVDSISSEGRGRKLLAKEGGRVVAEVKPPSKLARTKIGQNLYKREDGRFLVLVTRQDRDGSGRKKRRFIERVFRQRVEAERFRVRFHLQRQYETAGLVTPASLREEAPLVTLGDIFKRYRAQLETASRSMSHRDRVADVEVFVFKALGKDHPVPLTTEDLYGMWEWAKNPLNSKTKGDAIRKAFGVMATAHKRSGLKMGDAPEVKFRREGRRGLDEVNCARLLDALPSGSVWRTLAELMRRTVCREEEAWRLNVADVDIAGGVITFENRKGERAERIGAQRVPITAELREILELYARTRGPASATAPFLQVQGRRRGEARRLKQGSARRALEKACTLINHSPALNGFGWLRNLTVTGLVESGTPIDVASRMANHASVKTTEKHYDSAVLWDERKSALDRLAAHISAQQKPNTDGPNGPETTSAGASVGKRAPRKS